MKSHHKDIAITAIAVAVMITIFVILATACTREVIRYTSVPLVLPPTSELPTIEGSELACLTDDAYARLWRREQLIKRDRDECRAVIESTREKEK